MTRIGIGTLILEDELTSKNLGKFMSALAGLGFEIVWDPGGKHDLYMIVGDDNDS